MRYIYSVKGMTFDVRSLLVGGAAGFAVGSGAAYMVLRKSLVHHYALLVEQEVAEVKTHYNDRLKTQLSGMVSALPDAGHPFVGHLDESRLVAGESGDPDDGNAAMGAPEPDPLEGFEDDPGESADDPEEVDADGTSDPVPADQAVPAPVRRDIRKPYVISADEFAETPPGWQQLSLTYYAGDKVLTDEKDEPIKLIAKTTGPLSPLSFGGVSGDPHICYVRNQTLEADLEIVLDRRSYVDVILNYGNPNRGS